MLPQEHDVTDPIAGKLRGAAQGVLVIVFGLLPLFFLPSFAAPFGYTKIFFVIAGIVLALILFSLSTLRSGKVSIGLSLGLGALWIVAFVALLSTILSGDLSDSFIGDFFSTHSTAFVILLASIVTIWSLVGANKASVMRLYMLLALSTLILVAFHVLRLFLGADTLTLTIFTDSVSSPIGGWNDLALFLGLIVLLSVVAIEQLPLTKAGRITFAVVALLSLVMLTVINFFAVWIVLGLVSLVVLVYTLGRNRIGKSDTSIVAKKDTNIYSLVLSLVVFIISALFIVGGSTFGGIIADATDVSYLEVRPSFEATTDIARGVYGENAFLGTGANKFSDAWRTYKDNAINATVFWNTDFNAGNGYIPTFFVTTGVLGGVMWMIFLIVYIFFGARSLMRAPDSDHMWFFIGVSSFVASVYFWGMSIIYVPGAVILMLAALFTGISLVAQSALHQNTVKTFSVGGNKRAAFIFTLVVIALIIGSISTLYVTGRHYAAAYTFNVGVQSLQVGADLDEIEAQVAEAYTLSQSDLFARRVAEYQFARMNTLLALTESTEEQQQQFQGILANGINAAQQAVAADPTEPLNHAILGGIYSALVPANIEGSYERAKESLERARDLDPKNPLRYLALAELDARAGNFAASREYAREAIQLKQNYSNAFFFLSQLEIATGNVEAAIDSARAVIALEPQNPARYYQLGVLESANGNSQNAIAAFERAIQLDPDFANALYFLALAYDAIGRSDDAREQLERVLELNPGNQQVQALLDALDAAGTLGQFSSAPGNQITNDEIGVGEDGEAVTATDAPDSTLVNPVNTVPEIQEPAEEPTADAGNQNDESVVAEGEETEE